MQADFWHQKWQSGEIGFHEGQPNALLVKHFNALGLAQGCRVFLPLCGKTRDIDWLLTNGYRVAGAELSELAVRALFDDLGIEPRVESIGSLKHFSGKNVDIFAGDIFSLSADMLGLVDAVYDRAALVALPAATRERYCQHLVHLTRHAPQLLIAFQYDQRQIDGPPFSIEPAEVARHYSTQFNLQCLESASVVGGLKGKVAATETVWHLLPL